MEPPSVQLGFSTTLSRAFPIIVGFGRAFDREFLDDMVAIGGAILIVRLFS